MSSISSLLLHLLCLSFCVCNARRLGAITKESQEQFHLSSKSDEKASHVKISISGLKVKPTLWNNELGVSSTGERILEESEVHEDDHSKPKHPKADQEKFMKDHKRVKVSGSAKREPLVSVSWHAPAHRRHRKRKEQQPEFNSDYSLPRTHPPVHN